MSPPDTPPADSVEGSDRPSILLLGVDRRSMHHGTLGIARSAGRRGISVFVAHHDGRTPVTRSRYCKGSVRFPQDATADQRLEILRKFSDRHGRSVLIPVDDTSAMFVADHTSVLEGAFLFPIQPDGLARELASKREMHRLCLKHGIPTPGAAFPEAEEDVIRHGEGAEFPVVVKRIDGSLPAASSAPSVFIAQNPQELLDAYRLMESPQAPNILLQEYIPGTPESIWMFNGYFDAQSECRLAVTGQKIRQSPPYTGATTLGVCRPNPTVQEATKRLMKAVGYRGILDIGYRFDARDGQYKLLDVNPRIGATFRLFAAAGGLDVSRALYLDLTGQMVPASAAQDGRRWIVEPLDLRSSLTYIRRGDLTVGAWLRSYRHIDETAWWARDDPLPLFAESTSLLLGQLRKRLRRGGVGPRARWQRLGR